MTVQEMKSAIEQLKAEGHDEQSILGAFYKMFQDDKLTIDELDGIVNLMGYHLTDEFKNMSAEDQKVKGVKKTEEPAKDAEDVNVGKGKELSDDGKEIVPEDEDDSDDSDEEARAMKLFGQN